MELPEIPSEFIEPYLAKFMGVMVQFAANGRTEEEIEKNGGTGHTAQELKHWVKGLEVFVSQFCGIHARMAMMNEMYKFIETPDEEMIRISRKVIMGNVEENF
jgi:hypothetical protein